MFFEYKDRVYPNYIKEGNHAQYIIPLAKKVCTGYGLDVGPMKMEWAFPGAQGCDLEFEAPWNDGLNIPVRDGHFDFLFSSHCLEHIDDYYSALEEWVRVIKRGGTIFLYLPDISCEYWRPANNRKHKHIFTPEQIEYDLKNLGIENIFTSGVDLAFSFAVFGVKK